eukprot:10780748-Alexandrium_andersonii.AAC.1
MSIDRPAPLGSPAWSPAWSTKIIDPAPKKTKDGELDPYPTMKMMDYETVRVSVPSSSASAASITVDLKVPCLVPALDNESFLDVVMGSKDSGDTYVELTRFPSEFEKARKKAHADLRTTVESKKDKDQKKNYPHMFG